MRVDENHSKNWGTLSRVHFLTIFLKMPNFSSLLTFRGSWFHNEGPRKQKLLLVKVKLEFISIILPFWVSLHINVAKYFGSLNWRILKTVINDWKAINWFMLSHPNFCSNADLLDLGGDRQTSLAALFWRICNSFNNKP